MPAQKLEIRLSFILSPSPTTIYSLRVSWIDFLRIVLTRCQGYLQGDGINVKWIEQVWSVFSIEYWVAVSQF